MNKIKALLIKYKELITYVVFGVLTTLVNFVCFWALNKIFGDHVYLLNNAIAWIVSVIFAYVTNKLWVFESKSWNIKIVAREVVAFFAARLFSFGVEEGGLWLFVDILGMGAYSFTLLGFEITGQLIAKVILAVIVVILNYFFSKFIIFAKKKKKQQNNIRCNGAHFLRSVFLFVIWHVLFGYQQSLSHGHGSLSHSSLLFSPRVMGPNFSSNSFLSALNSAVYFS